LNIYTTITSKYDLDIAIGLVENGHKIAVVEINTLNQDRYPIGLDQFLEKNSPKVILEQNTYNKRIYENKSDPDFSIVTSSFLSNVDDYVRMMLYVMDRLYFSPLTQHEAHRLAYLYIANCYKVLKSYKIDTIYLNNIPHGLNQIALFAVAKETGIKIIYKNMLSASPYLSYLEEELLPIKRLDYIQRNILIKDSQNKISFNDYREQLFEPVYGAEVLKHNRIKQFAKLLYGVIRGKKGEYQLSQFFLEYSRSKVSLILSILRYHFDREKVIKFVKNIEKDPCLDEDYFIFFLHYQPEATTSPQADYFSDQLLNIKIILSALPSDAVLYVKEHPGTFTVYGQDKNFRNLSFYKEIIRDDRVTLISTKENSAELVQNARAVLSTCGSVTWEALCVGKPAVVFSFSWFAACDSCYLVNSTNDLKDALTKISKKISLDVDKDREVFIKHFYNIIIDAPPDMYALSEMSKNYDYKQGVKNMIDAIDKTIRK